MKKTKQIRLVLISAALASCNRQLTQFQPIVNHDTNSALTSPPIYDSSDYDGYGCQCLLYNEPYTQLWLNPYNPFGYYYNGFIGQYYYQRNKRNLKNLVLIGNHFIVRSGWGKTGMTMSGLS